MSRAAAKPGSPLPLRLLYAIVFLGFAASAIAAVYPEFLHLAAALRARFHPGTPPSPLAIASGVLAGLGCVAVAVNLARKKSTSLVVSALMLVGFAGALVFRSSDPPVRRTWQGADVAILEVARAVHLKMNDQLQRTAEVPREAAPWQAALAEAAKAGPSPVRTRRFAPVPYTLLRVAGQGTMPEGVDPASLVLWVSEDGVSFEVTPIGLNKSFAAGPMLDDRGQPIVLRGVFNPDAR